MLTASEKDAMRVATHEAASVLVDDLAHIKETVLKPEPTSGEVRRLSALLRRILINDDLRKIAAPRIGRIQVRSPDVRALHRENDRSPFEFAFGDLVDTYGISIALLTQQLNPVSRPGPIAGLKPGDYVSLNCDAFCKQRVICYGGQWISRADVIKYIANVASGVHTGEPKGKDFLVRKIRNSSLFCKQQGKLIIKMPKDSDVFDDPPLIPLREGLDLVILSFIATCQHLVESPDVIRLIEEIKEAG